MQLLARKPFVAGLVFIGLGIAFLLASQRYHLGSLDNMGAGFFPVTTAWLLVGVGILSCIKGALEEPQESLGRFTLSRPLIFIVGSVVVFGLTLPSGGLILATILLVGVAAFAEGKLDPLGVVWRSAGLLTIGYVLFIWLLDVPIRLLPEVLR